MITTHITDHVHYVGVNDRTTDLFESLWPLPHGVSYNSYVVKGELVAIIDTVEVNTINDLVENLRLTGASSPDFLVINHMEPDHSGAIPLIAEIFPKLKIIGNILTVNMIKGFYGINDDNRFIVIKDGDKLDLGKGITLSFHTIPMVHWPETMATYCEAEKVLFTGDAIGTFGALDEHVVDDNIDNVELYFSEMYRYYSCIVAKYADMVQRALKKLSSLGAEYICPTHGPVWHTYARRALQIYDDLSSHVTRKGAVVIYGSMYGNTAKMAEIISDRLKRSGVSEVRTYDAAVTDLSFMLAEIWQYNAVIIGAPTYNAAIFPPVANLLHALKLRGIKRHIAGAFGSFTWASAACGQITDALQNMGLSLPAESVDMKMSMTDDTRSRLETFADTLASHILND